MSLKNVCVLCQVVCWGMTAFVMEASATPPIPDAEKQNLAVWSNVPRAVAVGPKADVVGRPWKVPRCNVNYGILSGPGSGPARDPQLPSKL